MTFIPDRQLEARASELWRRFRLKPGFDAQWLLDLVGISLLWVELRMDVLGALRVDAHNPVVILNERRRQDFDEKPGLERFTIGHELGHWTFHANAALSGSLPLFEGDKTLCRDGSRAPEEIQAERFSSYLLMPTDPLKALLPTGAWCGWEPVYRLAKTFSVTATAMMVRLEMAGWAHLDDNRIPIGGRRPEPDSGQQTLPLT